jgi:hypothetical protein
MSVLDRIKALDAEKAKLLDEAKAEALTAANNAIKTLNELGFNYRLTSDESKAPRATSGGRRGGIRNDVLKVIEEHADGIGRAAILKVMGAEDKSSQQSISNALASLKKAGTVTADSGLYKAQ